MQPGRGKLRFRNVPRMAPSASSQEQNRLKTFHLGLNSAKTTPARWGHPDPKEIKPWGLEKHREGGRVGQAGGRSRANSCCAVAGRAAARQQ